MKVICTTSNGYLHIVPIFCYLFNKYWGEDQQVEIVGYDKPIWKLPANFTFVSMGQQEGDSTNFTRDLRKHFAQQPEYFVWMMEDAFLTKPVNRETLALLEGLAKREKVGRVNLTKEIIKQSHTEFDIVDGHQVYCNLPTALYRLSTQVSIWNREFLLANMQKDLSPWAFERQDDVWRNEWQILGIEAAPVVNNEGVRKWNVNEYDFAGIDQSILDDMAKKGII